jgi:hypothetical protein
MLIASAFSHHYKSVEISMTFPRIVKFDLVLVQATELFLPIQVPHKLDLQNPFQSDPTCIKTLINK